jgi:cation diffusion facilitator CzcD-associated flavoprotein CzcO
MTSRARCITRPDWPHEAVNFAGQRVGIVGTGSSDIQAIPIIAQQAAHLSVFQRTANYAVPLQNRPLDPAYVTAAKNHYSDWRKRERGVFGGFILAGGEPMAPPSGTAMAATQDERKAEYEFRYQAGGLCYYNSYADLLVSPESNETLAEFIRQKIRESVKDPVTAELLVPKDYPILAKRLPAETNYYETFNRDNVSLVDIKTTPIDCVTANGMHVDGKDYELDVLVFATGFDAVTGALSKIDIRGRGGLPLKQSWAAGPRTYLGLMAAGFPNLLNVGGPGSTALPTTRSGWPPRRSARSAGWT